MSPLPHPDDEAVYVQGFLGKIGPMSRRTLKKRVEAGEYKPTDAGFCEGMADWMPLAQCGFLYENLDAPAGPPPAPIPRPAPAPAVPQPAPMPAPTPLPAATGPAVPQRAPGEYLDDYKDRVFGELVSKSWDYYNEHAYATHIDEVFLGAVITSTLDTGYALIDLTSDGTYHFVRFENLQDKSRIIFRIRHLTTGLIAAKVLGQRVSIVVGYGEMMPNFGKVWQALQAEYKSGLIDTPEPGTITIDGDMSTQYVYVNVDLFWSLDDYIDKYQIHYAVLEEHISATLHALKKYLRGRFS